MRVLNIHQRKLEASPERVGKLLDSLSSSSDLLWPSETWVPMIFDRPLAVGATGGHGPIRYTVESYTPGQSVQFRFLAPEGFDGVHRFDITPADENSCILRHTIDMKASGRPLVKWLLVIRPLHDALIEECLSKAQSSLGLLPEKRNRTARVRLLKWLMRKEKANDEAFRRMIAEHLCRNYAKCCPDLILAWG